MEYILEPNVKINSNYKIEDKEFNSLYDLIIEGVKRKWLVYLDGYVAYIQDIKANYRDGELYIPLYRYDIFEEDGVKVRYNNRVDKIDIHTFKDGYKMEELVVIPNLSGDWYRVKLNNLKLSRDISDSDREARDLFYRYVAYSYRHLSELDIDVFDYNVILRKRISRKESDILSRNKLKFRGEIYNKSYRDVRRWDIEDIRLSLGEEYLRLDKPYKLRKMEFELELYTRLYDRVYWEKWTHGNWSEFISDSRIDYIKYKEKDIYLIFKKKWIANREE
ncbi:MAG: hypothetical protein QXD03_04465 [Candidatus Anstonellales archaeon]